MAKSRSSTMYIVTHHGITKVVGGRKVRTYDPTKKNINRMVKLFYDKRGIKKLNATVLPSVELIGWVVIFD